MTGVEWLDDPIPVPRPEPERFKVGDVVDYGQGFFPLRVEYVNDSHGLYYECSWVVAGDPVQSRAYYMHEHLRPHKALTPTNG